MLIYLELSFFSWSWSVTRVTGQYNNNKEEYASTSSKGDDVVEGAENWETGTPQF